MCYKAELTESVQKYIDDQNEKTQQKIAASIKLLIEKKGYLDQPLANISRVKLEN